MHFSPPEGTGREQHSIGHSYAILFSIIIQDLAPWARLRPAGEWEKSVSTVCAERVGQPPHEAVIDWNPKGKPDTYEFWSFC
jgi:hypothetical protein